MPFLWAIFTFIGAGYSISTKRDLQEQDLPQPMAEYEVGQRGIGDDGG